MDEEMVLRTGILIIMLLFLQSACQGDEGYAEGPFVIHQIVGDPDDPLVAYAITSNYGLLKSMDAGRSWKATNRGLKSFTHHAISVAPALPRRIYLGAWGGGVSRSEDGGENWVDLNDSLGNTAVDSIVSDFESPDRLYIATSTHFYRRVSGRWLPYEEGLPPFPGEIRFKSLLLLPGPPKSLWLGTARGLYYRPIDASSPWKERADFHGVRVSALAYDNASHRIWVGTAGQGLFTIDKDIGKTIPVPVPAQGVWISQIVLDPSNQNRIFLASRGHGIFRSTDGGTAWQKADSGLEESDIRSLALQPLNRSLLLAGTTSKGIYRSPDGGDHWERSEPMPDLSMSQIIAMLSISNPPMEASPVPEVISKCNQCHGWTDPLLNRKNSYWRVPPNRRNWEETVYRMSERASLSPDETATLIRFLNRYSRKHSK